MAHTIVGVDLGAFSVKFALIEAGFRHARLTSTFEEPIGAGEAPLTVRQAEALQRGLGRLPREITSCVAMQGDALTIRLLDLPFADPRKVDQVVGYELEGQIVHALSDLVLDHAIVRAPGATGSTVLAVAARIDDVAGLLAELGAEGLEPRSIFAAPVVYQALSSGATREEGTLPSCRALIDIGHLRTNVCVMLGGETVLARTLTRGGAALTASVAQALRCDLSRAEEIKVQGGHVASAAEPATTQIARQLDPILREALAPLVRELKQTLAGVRGRVRTPIESLALCGGTAALPGLASWLSEELDMPVGPWRPDVGPSDVSPGSLEPGGGESDPRFAQALALAWAGVRGRREIDLRRGPFVYRASYSILRQKAMHLSALAAAVLVSIGVDAGMALARLNEEQQQLEGRLKAATTELFGAPNVDGRQVTALLKKGFKDEMPPVPKATAFDLLDEVSRKMPGSDRIKIDVQELDIRPKKTNIKGTVDSAAAVDEIVGKLQAIECFEEINKGPITEVSGGAKQFTLTIASRCP
jgi:general secretion pathway protein L